MEFHDPVMVAQSIAALNPKQGVFVDATLGGAGHTFALLNANPDLFVYGFDQDTDALAHASKVLQPFAGRFELIHDNFANLRTRLALLKVKRIDGILFDLGVSSHQLDDPTRGFTFRQDAPLDLRMDTRIQQTAADLVNKLPAAELADVIFRYSEERAARAIARDIEKTRATTPFTTTEQLCQVIDRHSPAAMRTKARARVFQALRIYLNQELDVLKTALTDAVHLLNPGGRIAVISYHSLEDRIVKNFMAAKAKGCVCPPQVLKCICGQVPQLNVMSRKPLTPDEEEIRTNTRARSAKLRWAEKKEVA